MPSTVDLDAYFVYVGFDAASGPDRTGSRPEESAPSASKPEYVNSRLPAAQGDYGGLELTHVGDDVSAPPPQLLAEGWPGMATADEPDRGHAGRVAAVMPACESFVEPKNDAVGGRPSCARDMQKQSAPDCARTSLAAKQWYSKNRAGRWFRDCTNAIRVDD